MRKLWKTNMLKERVVPEQERLFVSLIRPINKVVHTLMVLRCAVVSPVKGGAGLIGIMHISSTNLKRDPKNSALMYSTPV